MFPEASITWLFGRFSKYGAYKLITSDFPLGAVPVITKSFAFNILMLVRSRSLGESILVQFAKPSVEYTISPASPTAIALKGSKICTLCKLPVRDDTWDQVAVGHAILCV